MDQMVLHLDRHTEFLLDLLNRIPGRTQFSLVITAAHGAPVEPPSDARQRMAVPGEQIAQALNRALPPNGPKVEKYVYPFIYLDGASKESEPARLAVARAAMSLPAVSGYYTAGGACSLAGDWAARFRNSFHPLRSGDVMLSYRSGYVEDFGAGRGISYGSLYNYDTSVPLLLYGPQFVQRNFEHSVNSVDVAPTLARALGVPQPSASTGRVLAEAFRRMPEPEP
jgi:arylsulfatase A-like enzyme